MAREIDVGVIRSRLIDAFNENQAREQKLILDLRQAVRMRGLWRLMLIDLANGYNQIQIASRNEVSTRKVRQFENDMKIVCGAGSLAELVIKSVRSKRINLDDIDEMREVDISDFDLRVNPRLALEQRKPLNRLNQVLSLLAQGKSNKQISAILFISRRTVGYYIQSLRIIYHARNVPHLMALAMKRGTLK